MIQAGGNLQVDREAPRIILRRRWAIPFSIAALGFVLNTIVATTMAETWDEPAHLDYGASILRGSADRSKAAFDSKMPVSAVNVLPRGIGKMLRKRGLALGLADKLSDFRAARYPTMFAAFGLSLLVYLHAKSLFGRLPGLFAQLLFVISPNITAHSTLATTDLYIALATALFLYCFRRFLQHPSTANAALTASSLALAQLTKFTAIYLYVVLLLFVFSIFLYSRYGHDNRCPVTVRQLGILLALHFVCSVVIINAGFLFDRTFTPLDKYEFRSTTFKTLQGFSFLRTIPLPLPYAYVQGFDWMSYHNATGLNRGNIALLNNVRGPELGRSDGFASYYLMTYVLKEPLGMQMLLLLGLLWTARHRRLGDFLTGEWLLLLTAGIFLLMLSLFSRTQIGIRHILPVLVISVILSAGAFATYYNSKGQHRALLCGCVLWVVVSAGSYFPHMIPYFNELLTDRKMAYRFLADSNLCWGQDTWLVQNFLKNNPDVVLDPPRPVTGRVLVNANLLAGVAPAKADYWLRQNRDMPAPIAHVGYAHLLFSIPPGK